MTNRGSREGDQKAPERGQTPFYLRPARDSIRRQIEGACTRKRRLCSRLSEGEARATISQRRQIQGLVSQEFVGSNPTSRTQPKVYIGGRQYGIG